MFVQPGGVGSIGAIVDDSTAGWTRVKWPNGTENAYRVGAESAFDLFYAVDEKRRIGFVKAFEVNARVKRSKFWNYADEDGNHPAMHLLLVPMSMC